MSKQIAYASSQVEVVFDWPWNAGPKGPPEAASDILPSSVAIAIGTATTMAAYLTTIFAKRLDLLNEAAASGPADGPDSPVVQLATRLMKCLVLHGTWDPKDSVEDVVLQSLRTKIQASARTRPTPLQLHASLARLVQLAGESRGRVTRATLYRELLNKHNQTASAKTRIPAEELSVVLLLDEAGPEFQDLVALAWQAESPAYSALPMSMLNQPFLLPETALPVPPGCNYHEPVWRTHVFLSCL